MKTSRIAMCVFLLITSSIHAQQEKGIIGVNNWLDNWTEFRPNSENYNEPTQILSGNISKDTKLSKRYTYLLLGSVFVTNNSTLTIEPGTVILGDYDSKASLTISKGSKIIADGLETDPIIFTSNRSVKKAGDWGGLIILGDAPTNKFGNGSTSSYHPELEPSSYGFTNFGGENPKSSSGILKYVRIEYAGKRIKRTGYFNGLLLASIGSETILENIMVSYCAGNSFEVWGGENIITKAVSYRASANDYLFNYGAQFELINSLAVKTPYMSSSEGSRALRVVSYKEKEEVDFTKSTTNVLAENLTLINDSKELEKDIAKGLVSEAVFVGYSASLIMKNSVVSGFNPAVLLDEDITINQENLEKIKFTGMFFNNCNGNIFTEYNSNNEDLESWYGNRAFFNVYSKSNDTETFISLSHEKKPDYRLRINKIIASNDLDPDLRLD